MTCGKCGTPKKAKKKKSRSDIFRERNLSAMLRQTGVFREYPVFFYMFALHRVYAL